MRGRGGELLLKYRVWFLPLRIISQRLRSCVKNKEFSYKEIILYRKVSCTRKTLFIIRLMSGAFIDFIVGGLSTPQQVISDLKKRMVPLFCCLPLSAAFLITLFTL